MLYEYTDCPVHFIGSIAWHFRTEVKEAADALGIQVGKIVKSPMEGLINYYFGI